MVGVREEQFPKGGWRGEGGKREGWWHLFKGMLLQEEKKLDRNFKQQKSFTLISPKVVSRPTASTLPGKLLEMHILQSQPGPMS